MNDLIKNELRSYNGYLQYRDYLKEKIKELQHELKGLRAVRYDKAPSVFNQEAYEQRRLGLIDRKDIYEGELQRVELNITYIERLLANMNEEDFETAMILVNGETYAKAGERMNYSISGIQHRLRKLYKHNKFI